MRPEPHPVDAGQESVWSYPRPPALERTDKRIVVRFGGRLLVDTTGAYRVLETSHPPTYYLPPDDVDRRLLREVPGKTSFCEWKGQARYFDVVVADRVAAAAAFAYPRPTERFAAIAGYVSLYAGPMDEVTVGGQPVTPQPGGFYSGWITPDVVGPFKGGPGSFGW